MEGREQLVREALVEPRSGLQQVKTHMCRERKQEGKAQGEDYLEAVAVIQVRKVGGLG